MSQPQFVTFARRSSRSAGETRSLLTQQEADQCASLSEAIRLCRFLNPDATCGEISRFLSAGAKVNEPGHVRIQHVNNTLNNVPKTSNGLPKGAEAIRSARKAAK